LVYFYFNIYIEVDQWDGTSIPVLGIANEKRIAQPLFN